MMLPFKADDPLSAIKRCIKEMNRLNPTLPIYLNYWFNPAGASVSNAVQEYQLVLPNKCTPSNNWEDFFKYTLEPQIAEISDDLKVHIKVSTIEGGYRELWRP